MAPLFDNPEILTCDSCAEPFYHWPGEPERYLCNACRFLVCLTARIQDNYLEKLETTSLLSEFTPSEESVVDWWNAIGRKTEDAARNWNYERTRKRVA